MELYIGLFFLIIMCIPFFKLKSSVIVENGGYFPLSQNVDPKEYKIEKDYERQEKLICETKELMAMRL